MRRSWVQDSLEAGYCLPTESYRVEDQQDQTQFGLDSTFATFIIPEDSRVPRCVEDTVNSTATLGKI